MEQALFGRRELLVVAAITGSTAVASIASPAAAQPLPAPAFTPQPLRFRPDSVPGLSEKLLLSHHDNNYVGAVKRLGAIEAQLSALDMATAPVFTLNGLKREELIAWNSMILHELYFEGFGKPSAPSPALGRAIEQSFGSYTRWAAEFSAMGKALGGSSGWVLLTWSTRDRRLVNTWAADHTMTLAAGAPLLALDMYEHAYALDYGSKAGSYVDAFMKVVDWRHASETFARLA